MAQSLAQQLYPDFDGWSEGDYQPIINSFGTVLAQVDDDDYSGDTRVLLKSGDKYGLLIFGWGSCSGCDALQACTNLSEIDQIINDLRNDIKWFDTLADAQTYVTKDDDRELDWFYHQGEWTKFKELVVGLN